MSNASNVSNGIGNNNANSVDTPISLYSDFRSIRGIPGNIPPIPRSSDSVDNVSVSGLSDNENENENEINNITHDENIMMSNIPLSLEQLDRRLTVVETLLATQSQLASNSFASNGGSLHLSHLLQRSTQNSNMSGNQLSVTQPLGRRRTAFHDVNSSDNEYNGDASTEEEPFQPPTQEGGKRRKRIQTKKQKKTKKRGNKGKRLTKRNRK